MDHHEKWGNDDIIILTFLPFCENGSEIQCHGEKDGYSNYRRIKNMIKYDEGRNYWDWTGRKQEMNQWPSFSFNSLNTTAGSSEQ